MLSRRLLSIAEFIPRGSRLADIGSDHALLPVYLLQNDICPFAIAGEVSDGPFRSAQRQIARAGLHAKIIARKGDGLTVVAEDQVDVVVIAGMGGSLMRSILEAGKTPYLHGVTRLVLQPNVGEEAVRRWLHENGWFLLEERILEEDGRIYEILVAERTTQATEDSECLYAEQIACLPDSARHWAYRMGPWLLRAAEPLLFEKWQQEKHKRNRMLVQMTRSNSAESKEKAVIVQQELNELEEILKCLQMVRP